MGQKITLWFMLAIGMFALLWALLGNRFEDMAWWQVGACIGLGVSLMIVGVRELRKLAAESEHHDAEHEFDTVRDGAELLNYIVAMGRSFTDLPDEADEARGVIDLIRGRYRALVRSFNANPNLGGPRRVELQMALGDYMVQVERVWSMLADGAYRQAYAVWREASNSRHLERLRELAATTN